MNIHVDIGYKIPLYSDVDITIKKGDIINIIGENGSGKSTFYKTLIGSIPPLKGLIPEEIKKNIATISDYISIPNELKVSDVLKFIGIGKVENTKLMYSEIYATVMNYESQKVGTLSSGQKRLLEIFSVLVNGKSILILDEACNALDLKNKDLFLTNIKKLASDNGVIIFHTSHNLEDVLFLEGTILVMCKEKGRIFMYDGKRTVECLSKFMKYL